MGMIRVIAAALLAGSMAMGVGAQTPAEHETLKLEALRGIVERGGLDVVALEPGTIMVSDGKGFPARLSLAGCDRGGSPCRVVRIYTRYVIGDSQEGLAAMHKFAADFTSATLILALAAGEPAVDVGRDASLEGGRTEGEILGEIATAMSDARLLREKLMEADPFLKATLGRN
jgi:hypothetical protein